MPYITEASAWLAGNANAAGFASNRFKSMEDAAAFVAELYDRGAALVAVEVRYDEEFRLAREGGPYADTLLVTLPRAPEQAAAVRAFCADAGADEFSPAWEGYGWQAADKMVDHTRVRLWWD